MLFCSETLIESSSSQEDDVLFPQNSQTDLFPLKNCIIVPKETSSSWNQTTTLPPPAGTPLSIFEFAGLSPAQQKQWLEVCSDMKQNTATQQRNKSTRASKVLTPVSRSEDVVLLASWCEQQSCKTDETDSITSLSSSRSDAQCPNGTQKRSIFAPYWAKTGERTGEKTIHDPDHHVLPCTAPGNKKTTVQILDEASQISMILPHHHLSTTSTRTPNMIGRGCCGGDQYIPRPAPRLNQEDKVRIATLSEQPRPILTPQRRAVSTSAISILKNKKQGDDERLQEQGGEGRRRRSSSFSVSFDSRVNVVLVFQDKPPYHTRRFPPWWARLLSGTGTGEFDGKEVLIEARCGAGPP